MRLRQLFTDDDAVSPVIGVILMVAITVILAAVIASFVLGLGDTADEVQPTSSLTLDNVDDNSVTISLSSGDELEFDELFLRGSGIEEEAFLGDDGGSNDLAGETWQTGESYIIGNDSTTDPDYDINEGDGPDTQWVGGETVNLVWEEDGGDNSATLFEFDAP